MKKYIRAIICVLYSFIKFTLIKIMKFGNFNFTAINLVSPFTTIEMGKNSKLKLGKKIKIRGGTKVLLRNNAKIEIGDNTGLNYRCMIVSHEKIIIGSDVQIGPNVLMYDHDHDFRKKNGLKNLDYKTESIEIGNNVWIGANVIILKGSKIGDNSVIAAGSIVKGNYDENSIIVQKRITSVNSLYKFLDGDKYE